VVGVTVAESVTDCPLVEGFGDAASAMIDTILLTVCGRTADVLVASLVSPLYTAVIECDPTVNVVSDNAAEPPLIVTVPSEAEPSRN